MRYLIFGETGQVASELARRNIEAEFLSRSRVDLCDPAAVARAIDVSRPDVVLNAAAWTDVDGAETESEQAIRVNGTAPGAMARATAALGIPLVHISTDYVFDGAGDQPFSPGDPVAPIGAYGRSKLLGEEAVIGSGGAYAILRTSWVFSAHGNNFVKTMLRLGATRDSLRVVDDQIGGPTSASAIAGACIEIAQALVQGRGRSGVYHFAGAPDVSWADFARAILAGAGTEVTVEDIPSSAYPTLAARPLNSRLDCRLTDEVFAIARPDWRIDLDEVLKELMKPK